MPDKYDVAIKYLTRRPNEISRAWNYITSHPAGCLFQYAGNEMDDCHVGCLTMIRTAPGSYCAATPELTKAIAADERIPLRSRDTKVEHLPVFAEWQRRLDKELNRS